MIQNASLDEFGLSRCLRCWGQTPNIKKDVLDAYIIEEIRKEERRRRERSERPRLHIEIPKHPDDPRRDSEADESAEIDPENRDRGPSGSVVRIEL